MLAITVELLHGTIRAGSPDDTVLAGLDPTPEWPPSPARLFSALVAADGTRERCQVTTGAELAWLEQLPPPVVHASPPDAVLASPLEPRFVVAPGTAKSSVQEYSARHSRQVHPGVRQAPFSDSVTYVWPKADAAHHLPALQRRAARVGYLGCADSPVRLRVTDGIPIDFGDPWHPDSSASFTLPVPYPGFLDALESAFDSWSSGQPMRRAWIRSVRSGYRPPGDSQPETAPSPPVIWLRLDRPVVGRKLLAVTATLRDAVLDHVQRLMPAGEEVPTVLHGHRPAGESGNQARFVALPDVGHEHADGRLLGAAVWLPTGTVPEVVQVVRSALARLGGERLVKPGWFDIGIALHAGERRPWAASPRRWCGPARRWASATPVIHERWSKGPPDLGEATRWCEHAGLPAPTAVRVSRRPRLAGALDLHPTQVTRAGHERRPYSHIELEFSEEVTGPVLVGRGRQFGLGLMCPEGDKEADRDA
jgi:CRISPR-associated protein Csb2